MRISQKKKRGVGKAGAQNEKKEATMKQAHQEFVDLAQFFLNKSEGTLKKIISSNASMSLGDLALLEDIRCFATHGNRQIDQIIRRVLKNEIITHEEKVFSLFQPHTEWISKGKAGVPVELGLRVCIIEDQHQFILHHRVMEKETDDQVAVPMIVDTKVAFPELSSCSFDKGFHSPNNQEALAEHLEVVALKRKGKLSKKTQDHQASEPFKKAAHKHSAVESAINALEVHGLDKCRDQGIDGFKRYVALSVVTRNIHRIGELLYQRERKKLARKNKNSQEPPNQLAFAA